MVGTCYASSILEDPYARPSSASTGHVRRLDIARRAAPGPGCRGSADKSYTILFWACPFLRFFSAMSARSRAYSPKTVANARCSRREVARARAAAGRRLAVELATLRGMNHMCTALANRVGAYNS